MQVTNQLLATSHNPYQNEAINKMYNQLFCDNTEVYETTTGATEYPWNILFAENPNIEQLKAVTVDETLQSRHKILAYNILAAIGAPADKKELLGVIIEVALPEGLDVIAAFQDGTARYINYSEKLLIWETETAESRELISKLFSDSLNVVGKIGAWDKERLPSPANEKVRLSFLVSDGLYFGEGPFDFLQKDPMGGPVIGSAAALMNFLIESVVNK
ncbi:MAG: hypothetical protein ABI402_19075 [Ferruginibacter sp.]